MKSKHAVLVFIFTILLISWPCHAQEWSITYGGSSSEGASSIQEVGPVRLVREAMTFGY